MMANAVRMSPVASLSLPRIGAWSASLTIHLFVIALLLSAPIAIQLVRQVKADQDTVVHIVEPPKPVVVAPVQPLTPVTHRTCADGASRRSRRAGAIGYAHAGLGSAGRSRAAIDRSCRRSAGARRGAHGHCVRIADTGAVSDGRIAQTRTRHRRIACACRCGWKSVDSGDRNVERLAATGSRRARRGETVEFQSRQARRRGAECVGARAGDV